ncbi:MAG: CHAT domain-containing tetratricopeptide repeat protein [Thermodesulfobacteriota bacterium]
MSLTWNKKRPGVGSRKPTKFLWTILLLSAFSLAVPDMLLAHGPKGGAPARGPRGGGGGGGGFGIGIGIMIGPRMPVEDKGPDFDKIERDLMEKAGEDSDTPKKVKSASTQAPPPVATRKLTQPRIPYLLELAIDIDRTVLEMARNEPARAVQFYRNAVAQAKKRGDLQAERYAAQNLGHVLYLTGRFERARQSYEQALSISRHLTDTLEQGIALRNIAAALTAAGEYDQGEAHNGEALTIFMRASNSRGARMVLNNQGVLQKNRGRYDAAMETFERSLALDKEQDRLRALTLANMAKLNESWGDFRKAIDGFSQVLELARSAGDPREEGDTLLNIARTEAEWGRYDQALESGQKALEVLSRSGLATDRAKKTIGDVYLDMGKLAEAEPYVKESEYDSSLGRFYLLKSQLDQAKRHYEMLLGASHKEANLDEQFTAHTGLGKVFEATKDYRQAQKHYSKAVDITEEIRSSLLLSERKNFFSRKVNGFARYEPAKGLIRVTLKQNKPQESIFPSESVRAREFADLLSQRAEGVYFNVPPETLQKEAEINNKLASIKTAAPIVSKSVDPERFSEISKQLSGLETAKKSFVQALWKDHEDYASVKYPKPVQLKDASLGVDEYAIVFDVLGEGLAVKLLKGKKILDAAFIEWQAPLLEADIAKFRNSFEEVDFRAFDPNLALSLYQKLLDKALRQVPAGSQVCIIPDGVLALLPFEALVTGGSVAWNQREWGDEPQGLTYVGDVYTLTYYQSLTAMALVRNLKKKQLPGERVLVVADPVFEMQDARAQTDHTRIEMAATGKKARTFTLMAAIEEESGGHFKLNRLNRTADLAKGLESLYGQSCDTYTGFEANKAVFLSKIAPFLDRYKSVVFATHGFAANQIPGIMEPVLCLTMVPPGTDGYLTISEVAGLKMNVDVAALTACQTGTGVRLAGEGVMSMGRAFQCAGARSVLMSLWSVAESTSVLMTEEFFKQLRNGKGKREAWTSARVEARRQGFDHPFFWGAFILVGEAD